MAADRFDCDACPHKGASTDPCVSSDVSVAAYQYEGARLELKRCPRLELAPAVARAVSFYPWIQFGTWPSGGGVLDQSATLVHSMGIFAAEVNRLEQEEMEKARSKHGR